MKKISVITSVLNGENTIEHTILSVLNQDYNNFELIIIDGLSTDSTIKIINYYANSDNRIKIISEKDEGIYDAFNKGILYSSGDIIIFINADDFLFPNALISINKNFKYQTNDLFAGSLAIIDEKNQYYKEIFRSKISNHSLTNPVILTIGICFNRKVFDKVGLFDISYRICADVDFIYRCLNYGIKIQYNDILLSYMREGGVSSNYKFEILKKREQFKAHYNNSVRLDFKYTYQLILNTFKSLILNIFFKQKLIHNKRKFQDNYDEQKIFWFENLIKSNI